MRWCESGGRVTRESTDQSSIVLTCGGNAEIDSPTLVVGQFGDEAAGNTARRLHSVASPCPERHQSRRLAMQSTNLRWTPTDCEELCEQYCWLRPRNYGDQHSGRPHRFHSRDCTHHFRITIRIINPWNNPWIGKLLRHIKRKARLCKRKKPMRRRCAVHGTFSMQPQRGARVCRLRPIKFDIHQPRTE
jgi:hypothetical protein